uniref:C2H2-type domain-containing protein n=1 Tax=Timema tahoe TaxID=61484 RepID=A0A7R9I909_9NEOP|nr:unnamed protein product [Timema tahoe]
MHPVFIVKVIAVSKKAVHKQKQTAVKRKRGRPRGRPPSKKVNVVARKRTARKRASQVSISPPPPRNKGKKRSISPQPTVRLPKKWTRVVPGNWRTTKILKESDTSSDEDDNLVKTATTKEENKCFVCEKQVSDGTPLGTLTTTSRAPIRHKLDRIAAGARGHLDLSQDPGGVLCSHCTCVLNHLDQIEVELNLLTKSVLNALLKKYGLATLVNDKGEVDENIEGTYLETGGDMENTNNQSDKSLAAPDAEHSNSHQDSNNQTNNVNIKETPSKEYHCHVCFYTCNKKSLLVFHLRDHLKRNCHRCDFCNLYIEEGELHNHGDQQHVKPYVKEIVTLDRKDSENIQGCPKQVASETPKLLKVSENQANNIYGSKEHSSQKMSQNGDHVEVVEMPTKENREKKCVTSSEMNYATDVSFVALPITGQSSHIITSTLSDLGGKHELEMLDYISSEMSSLIRTESDTIESVLGDIKADYKDGGFVVLADHMTPSIHRRYNDRSVGGAQLRVDAME